MTEKVLEKSSDTRWVGAPTYDGDPNRGRNHSKEHPMSTVSDADQTTYAPRADAITTVSAWSSSPLGDPSDGGGRSLSRDGFPPDPITPPVRARSISKGAVAGGLIGTLGVGAALGMALFGNWTQPRPVTVAPGSAGVPASVPAAVAPAPVISPPASGPAPADGPAPAAVVNPPADNGPAPADPGSPPPPAPSGPIVIVNPPAPPDVSVTVQPAPPPSPAPQPTSTPNPKPTLTPQPKPTLTAQPDPTLFPQPKPTLVPQPKPKLGPAPVLCMPPQHSVNGVCK
jgi:hypothetical protein